MTGLRRVLRRWVLTWVLFQATTVAVGAAASWQAVPKAEAEACTCEHAEGVMCPMHRQPATATRCLIGNDRSDHDGFVPGGLLYGAGLVSSSFPVLAEPPRTVAAIPNVTPRRVNLLPPDTRPPRA